MPGRGSYNREDLGYFQRYHGGDHLVRVELDNYRKLQNRETLTDLDDAERLVPSRHARGDNAALLVYACAYADYTWLLISNSTMLSQ